MIFLQKLRKEHEEIERELIEIETIINDSETGINYSNLIHVLKKLYVIWDSHEIREEGAFKIFKKEKIKIPVETIIFEHKKLKPHKEKIKNAIESGSEFNIKESLNKDLRKIVFLLREHISKEEEILYSIPLEVIFNEKEKEEIDKRFGV